MATNQKSDNQQHDNSDRSFASMDNDKQREIASKGGRAAHEKGAAHEFDSDQAAEAGRKGGQSRSASNNSSWTSSSNYDESRAPLVRAQHLIQDHILPVEVV